MKMIVGVAAGEGSGVGVEVVVAVEEMYGRVTVSETIGDAEIVTVGSGCL